MKYYRPTILFIVAIVAMVTLYDVWAVAHGYEKTISSTLFAASRDWPAIPFMFGFLAGHLFFPNRAAGTKLEDK